MKARERPSVERICSDCYRDRADKAAWKRRPQFAMRGPPSNCDNCGRPLLVMLTARETD